MKIYTKTGDKGTTGLIDGSRVSKSSDRIELIGIFDELNSYIGWTIVSIDDDTIKEFLYILQSKIFDIGADIASGEILGHLDLDQITSDTEEHIDTMELSLDPLQNFILPGGSEATARIHIIEVL